MHEKLHGSQDSAPPGGGGRRAQDGDLIEQRDAIARGLAYWIGKLIRRQKGNGQGSDDAAARWMRQMSDYYSLKMRDQSRSIRLLHLHQDNDDRLARLQQEMQKLRWDFIVVALIRSNVDEDVGQCSRFQETRQVAAGCPGRHVGAVPDDEIFEQIAADGIGFDAADLIHVFIEIGRTRLGQQLQSPQKARVGSPVNRTVAAGVSDRMPSEAGLRIGFGGDGAAEEVSNSAFARTGTADDHDMSWHWRLLVEHRPDAVTDQSSGQMRLTRRLCLSGLVEAVLL